MRDRRRRGDGPYAIGERSSRRIERHTHEHIAFRVIAANQGPDHATIARFRARHDDALAALFGQVLGLCAKAGLVSVGVIALDGTKIHAAASGQAKRALEAEQAAREPVTGHSRTERLAEAKRRLEEEWRVERWAIAEHERWRERRTAERAAEGKRMIGAPPTPKTPPAAPTGRINVTDPDSRPVKGPRGFLQGYNAQVLATPEQIVIAADVRKGTPDGGLLEPMAEQARTELAAAGIPATPGVLLADAGYWHTQQIERLVAGGVEVLVPPEGHSRRTLSPNRKSGLSAFMRRVLDAERGRTLYRKRQHMVEPIFAQTKVTRRSERFQRRGLAACRAEWRLITATHNLLKLWRASAAPATG